MRTMMTLNNDTDKSNTKNTVIATLRMFIRTALLHLLHVPEGLAE